jgi:hypothetical protein
MAEIEPRPSESCPEATRILVILSYNDGTTPITATIDPPLDWSVAEPDGPPQVVTVRPVPPNT